MNAETILLAITSSSIGKKIQSDFFQKSLVCEPKITPITSFQNKKVVILRLDDVQGDLWRDISMKMIEDAYKYAAPLVIGIIPARIHENGETLADFLKQNHCNIEIAIHGWDHFGEEDHEGKLITEFGNVNYPVAYEMFSLAKKELGVFSKKPPITFIPPYNEMSAASRRAAGDHGIQVISSLGGDMFDYHAKTYDFDYKRIVSVDQVVSDCENGFKKYGHCVVMLHPQDFALPSRAVDPVLYHENYIKLLEKFREMNVAFTTFENYLAHSGSLE